MLRPSLCLLTASVMLCACASAAPVRGLPSPSVQAFEAPPTESSFPAPESAREVADREVMRFGYPGTAHLVYREGYVLSYDDRTRQPFWVAEHLTRASLRGKAPQMHAGFREDQSVDAEHRARLADYAGSAYVQGALVPPANLRSEVAADQTLLLSNTSPQVGPGFQDGYWRGLENAVRSWARVDDVLHEYVFTGPLFLPQADGEKKIVRYEVLGESNIAVPTHFFKVICVETTARFHFRAFILPNAKIPAGTPLKDFLVTIDTVERASGLDFFSAFSDEEEKIFETWEHAEVFDF